MRVLLQRVQSASVTVAQEVVGSIGRGYVLFLGIVQGDSQAEADWLAEKIVKLRLFDGPDGKINDRSLFDIGGGALIISQFTLAGDVQRGNRPDYTAAEKPESAEKLYNYFVQKIREIVVLTVQTGKFGASMQVQLLNDGPVTLLLEKSEIC